MNIKNSIMNTILYKIRIKIKAVIVVFGGIFVCVNLCGCDENNINRQISTIETYNDIGNMCQSGLVAATPNYIYFPNDLANIYKMDLRNGNISFACENPVCQHNEDCASAYKTHLQTLEDRIFALGNFEVKSGSTIVYSSFGEIKNGSYEKIYEENTMIFNPIIVDNRIISAVDNKIKLVDINTKKTVKEYEFNEALDLREIYCIEDTIYYVNGLGNFYKIDGQSSEISLICEDKMRCVIPYEESIYYINIEDNSLCRINSDGSGKEMIYKKCNTFNMLNGMIYLSKASGVFAIDMNGENEKKICDLKGILFINIFENQNKLVCSNYEKIYIGNLDGSDMIEPEFPENLMVR